MQAVLSTAKKIATSDLSVVIVGEHGAGKEWLARMIHQHNLIRTGPFWPFDCAAIPVKEIEKELFGSEEITQNGIAVQRGAFEEAEHGTLLLNEIDALPIATQLKISRTIEFRNIHRLGSDRFIPVDVRIIATLSQPASPLLKDGTLTTEMYYRISPIVLEIPPLRKRKEDIPWLIEKLLVDLQAHNKNSILGITPEAMLLCLEYEWPGNVRQLKNALEYAFIMCNDEWIQPQHFPSYLLQHRAAKPSPVMSAIKK